MKFYAYLLLALLLSNPFYAQTTIGLVAHYDFEEIINNQILDQTGNSGNNADVLSTQLVCGVQGNGLEFDGLNSKMLMDGIYILDQFGTEDFSISFYFKTIEQNVFGTQTLISKRNDCSIDSAFAIRYSPSTHSLNVTLSENVDLNAIIDVQLNPTNCWHHVCLTRNAQLVSVYVDGILADKITRAERIDITNDALPLQIGESSCSITDGRFEGVMDELRIYNRALLASEVEELYFRPDNIGNGFVDLDVEKDTVLYLGENMLTFITNSCASTYQWSPAIGVVDPNLPQTIIQPTQSTTYTLSFLDSYGCLASDSIVVTVIDPETLDCQPFLANSFTPNDDGLNDTFGIDNYFALRNNLISFEIYDRYGNQLFFTENPEDRWDGIYKNSKVNLDSYLYIIRYTCQGEEKYKSGSITILE